MSYQAPAPDCICQAINFIEVFSFTWGVYPLTGKTLLNREIH